LVARGEPKGLTRLPPENGIGMMWLFQAISRKMAGVYWQGTERTLRQTNIH